MKHVCTIIRPLEFNNENNEKKFTKSSTKSYTIIFRIIILKNVIHIILQWKKIHNISRAEKFLIVDNKLLRQRLLFIIRLNLLVT